MVQCCYVYVIVDEVDFIFIDEVWIFLIIFGLMDDCFEFYCIIDKFILNFDDEDIDFDEKMCFVVFIEEGFEKMEQLLNEDGLFDGLFWDLVNVLIVYYLNQVLKVYKLFYCDKDYIVKDDQVMLIDEFIGWMMEGWCLLEGLYQVIEVKENVDIKLENQMLVLIMFQNYFCFYNKFVGMIGMVMIEVFEFVDIYGFFIFELLINKLIQWIDEDDVVYCVVVVKYKEIVEEVCEVCVKG